jgi:hypothetical protein
MIFAHTSMASCAIPLGTFSHRHVTDIPCSHSLLLNHWDRWTLLLIWKENLIIILDLKRLIEEGVIAVIDLVEYQASDLLNK